MSFWDTLGNVAKTAGNIMNPIGAVADIGLGFMNYSQQKQNLAYQKDMQQQAWAREDNATQRRVEDLKAAGLSPTLAAGSAAQASAPIQTHAPQYDGPSLQQKALDYLSQSQMRANIAQTQAQSALIDTQRKVIEHDYGIYSEVPGQISTDKGTLPGLERRFNEWRKKIFNGEFTLDLSKPAVSADYGEVKKSKGVGNDNKPDEYKWDSAESIGQMFEKFKKEYGIKAAESFMKATYGDDWYNRMMNNVK